MVRHVIPILFATALLLTFLSVLGHGLQYFYGPDRFVQFVRLFNISGEANVPTWFTAMLLAYNAQLAAHIGAGQEMRGTRDFVVHWYVLALAFAYISLDEVAQIHEQAIDPLRARFQATGVLYFAWVIPAGVILGLLAVAYLRFLSRLPRQTRVGLVVSAVVYVTGAFGMELVTGYLAYHHPDQILLQGGFSTLEDLLEMSGLVLCIYTLLDYRTRVKWPG